MSQSKTNVANDAKIACAKRYYEVTCADLPLSCPMPDMRLWDAHPRVYLPIEVTGHEVCPYCEAEFTLTDFEAQDQG